MGARSRMELLPKAGFWVQSGGAPGSQVQGVEGVLLFGVLLPAPEGEVAGAWEAP